MQPIRARQVVATTLLFLAAQGAAAQERRQGPGGGGAASNETGEARDDRNPFAGLWRGRRALGSDLHDELGLRFTAIDGKYVGYMIVGEGGHILSQHLTATSGGLTWDSPNSGGGTWVYNVRLAGPDSLVGTLELRDPPDNLSNTPKGTLVFKRVPAGKSR